MMMNIDAFEDPISCEPMDDPVIISGCGHSYNRSTVMELLQRKVFNCPQCQVPFTHRDIKTNYTLRNAYEEYLKLIDSINNNYNATSSSNNNINNNNTSLHPAINNRNDNVQASSPPPPRQRQRRILPPQLAAGLPAPPLAPAPPAAAVVAVVGRGAKQQQAAAAVRRSRGQPPRIDGALLIEDDEGDGAEEDLAAATATTALLFAFVRTAIVMFLLLVIGIAIAFIFGPFETRQVISEFCHWSVQVAVHSARVWMGIIDAFVSSAVSLAWLFLRLFTSACVKTAVVVLDKTRLALWFAWAMTSTSLRIAIRTLTLVVKVMFFITSHTLALMEELNL